MGILTEIQLTRGHVYSENPAGLPLGAIVDGRNVVWDRGRLAKRPGFTYIAGGASLPVWTSNPGLGSRCRWAGFFRDNNGIPHLVACTATGIYAYVASTNSFQLIASWHSGADNGYIDAETWGGTLYLVKAGGDFWAWDGQTAGGASLPVWTQNAAGDRTTTIGMGFRYLRAFGSALVGAYPTIAGSDYPQSIYWSAPLLPEDWTGAGSGNNTRRTLRGSIAGLETVGRGLALFADESIEMIGEGPDITTPFTFEPAEPTVGTPAPHSITKLGPPFSGMLVFLGSDLNIHTFNGYRAEPVAWSIHPFLRANLERDYLYNAWAHVWPELGVYRLAVPTSGSSENNLIIDWWYNLPSPVNNGLGQFYIHQFAGGDGAWSAAARWVKAAPATWLQRRSGNLTWAQRRALRTSWGQDRTGTGRREVAFLGAGGLVVEPFAGANDGGLPVSAYAEFAPTDLGEEILKEVRAIEVMDDRTGGAALTLTLGHGRDGVSWTEAVQTHTCTPTDRPFVGWEAKGRYFRARVANAEADKGFHLRGLRLLDTVDER